MRRTSYLTLLLAASSMLAATLALLAWHTEAASAASILAAALLALLAAYSLATLAIGRRRIPYELILSKHHQIIHEIREFMAFPESPDLKRLSTAVATMLQHASSLFTAITDTSCRASIVLFTQERRIGVFSATSAGTGRSGFLQPTVLDSSPFRRVLEGERYSLCEDVTKTRDYEATSKGWWGRYRSSAVFPISTFDEPRTGMRQRVIYGFLVIDSPTLNAFPQLRGDDLSRDMVYRSGAVIADSISLITARMTETLKQEYFKLGPFEPEPDLSSEAGHSPRDGSGGTPGSPSCPEP